MKPAAIILWLSVAAHVFAGEHIVNVRDDASLQTALSRAQPGVRIRIAPGNYRPRVYVRGLRGNDAQPIVIEGADANRPPRFSGGSVGLQLSECSYVTLRHLVISGQSGNGLNVDDGGKFDTPSHHITLEDLQVSDIGPQGNLDGIKLSGVDEFAIRRCRVHGWGGEAIDMVGCHRGLIEQCLFKGKVGFSQHTGVQTKGGSSEIVIRRCMFLNAGMRGVNLGGSTGTDYFRPPGAKYEAKHITVEGCVLVGGMAPVAYVGVDGATVRYNTIVQPNKWVLRILQETTAPGFVACRNGRFERNMIVYRRADTSTLVNVGPHTDPASFVFIANLWYCEDDPRAAPPELPTAEARGVYTVDPRLQNLSQNRFQPQNPRAAAYGAWALPTDDRRKP